MADYEDIIEDIGGFGKWQRIIFISLFIPEILFAFAIILPVFTGAEPKWSCAGRILPSNVISYNSSDHLRHGNFVNLKNDAVVQNISDSVKHDYKCTNCPVHHFNDTFTSIVSQWDLVCNRDYISDLITSIQMSGMLFGAAIFGQMSDLVGRKKAHFTSVLLLAVSGTVSAFAVNWQMFAVFRFLLGISAGGYYCVACVYSLEFVNRRWRTLCGAMGFWQIAQLILAVLAFLIRDWRYLTLTTALCCIPYFLFWWLIPESPRWLAQKGCITEAKNVFRNIAEKNGRLSPDFSSLDEYELCKKETQCKRRYTYIDLFKSREMAKRAVVCMIVWFTVLLMYYEISYNIKHLSGNRYLNVIYGGLFEFIGMLLVLIFNNILGRRKCLMISLASTAAVNIAILGINITNKENSLSTVITGLALVGKCLTCSGTVLMQIYSAELFPTYIRNVGVGSAVILGRVGTFLAPQLLYLGTHYKLIPYIVLGTLGLLVVPLLLLVPETNGKPLVDNFNLRATEADHDELKNINNVTT